MSGQHADDREILIDGKHYTLTVPLNEVNLNTWPGKTVIGDYSKDDNDLLSSWIISDCTGGNGVQKLNTAVDQSRYNIAGIYTRYPNQFSLPWVWDKSAPISSANAYYPLTDRYSTSWEWYAVSGLKVMRDDVDLGLTALTAAPVSKGCAIFSGTNTIPLIFIPMGASGYATYNRPGNVVTNVAAAAAVPAALWFITWDDKLICLDVDGQLWKNVGTTAAGWVSYGPTAKLPAAGHGFPIGLVNYVNANGDPTVHIVTQLGLWAFDAAGPKLWQTKLEMPPHIHAGAGFCIWRGDLYISAGLDVIQWSGSVQRNVGLSRDDGLSNIDADAYIIDLEASLNSVTAVVFNTHTGSTVDFAVHEYSGLGWHMLYRGAGTGQTPTWAKTSRETSAIFQHTYVGFLKNGRIRQKVPASYTNPRAMKASGLTAWGLNGTTGVANPWEFYSGRFDGGMKGYRKCANAVEVFVNNYDAGYQIFIDYAIDGGSYTVLGEVTAAGLNYLPFGTQLLDGNGTGIGAYSGVSFNDIELKMRYVQNSYTGGTPIVEFIAMTYLKLKKSAFSWVAQLELRNPDSDRSPEQIRTDILALADRDTFFTMEYSGYTKRIRFAQSQGNRMLADDERGSLTINILEVPSRLAVG